MSAFRFDSMPSPIMALTFDRCVSHRLPGPSIQRHQIHRLQHRLLHRRAQPFPRHSLHRRRRARLPPRPGVDGAASGQAEAVGGYEPVDVEHARRAGEAVSLDLESRLQWAWTRVITMLSLSAASLSICAISLPRRRALGASSSLPASQVDGMPKGGFRRTSGAPLRRSCALSTLLYRARQRHRSCRDAVSFYV